MIYATVVALVIKNPSADAGAIRDVSFVPGSGRSRGGGRGSPPQYSCLGNPVDRGAWRPQSAGPQNQTPVTARACAQQRAARLSR